MLRSPTRYTLGSMVSHFQRLFDVTSLSGVYPRMNEVYTRLGEMTNTMRNLRDVLELGNLQLEAHVLQSVWVVCSVFKQKLNDKEKKKFSRCVVLCQTAGFLLLRW